MKKTTKIIPLDVKISKEIQTTEEKVLSLEIKNAEDVTAATALLSTFNKNLDSITEEKEKVTKPLNAALAAERARWKPMETKLTSFISKIRSGLSIYQTEQTRIAQKKEENIADRVGEGRGKLTIETAVRRIGDIERPETKVHTEEGSLQFRTDKKLKVLDITKIPRKYFELDESKLLKYLKAGIMVPGAEVEEIQVPINKR